ncbi:PTS sugar transporter subunit IIC, partial [Bacteroides thetaiotaomicron]
MKNFFEDKFVPVAAKIAKQRHLLALRDGLVLSLPLLIVGSMFIIIGELPIQAYQDFMASVLGEGWGDFVWNDIFPATTGIIALLATFGITKSLVDSYDIDGLPAGAIAVAAFFLLNTLDAENNMWNADLFGAVNMFTGIIVALVVGEVYRRIVQKNLVIHMPD